MNILVASDHAGFDLKAILIPWIEGLGHKVSDLGVYDRTPSDYPDVAEALALDLLAGKGDRGVLICGSGVGVSVAANKIPGIRAGVCHDSYSAHQGVEHDDMNILVMGSRTVGTELAKDLVRIYLDALFTHEERHVRRLGKVAKIEERYCGVARPVPAGSR